MRQPTPHEVLYRWHHAAVAGECPPTHMEPECGYFLARRELRGQFIPASIYMDQPTDEDGELTGDETMRCEIGGQPCDPGENWPWLAKRPTCRLEYNRRLAAMMGKEDAIRTN